MKARILILHAPGTNRDREAALACRLAGGEPEIVPLSQLLAGERRLLDYGFLVLPGGFSYGDDLGAGTLWALALKERLGEELRRFVADGRPVLGICNGFQALIKAGLLGVESLSPSPSLRSEGLSPLPAQASEAAKAATTKAAAGSQAAEAATAKGAAGRLVTLTRNRSGHFECRWVYLRPEPGSGCLFTRGLEELLYVPVAHGEGNLTPADQGLIEHLHAAGQVALTYVDATGQPAGYPANPNGSAGNIAGLCNAAGNVLGLMPHPEDHVFPYQHPRWTRGEHGGLGLALFINGVRAAGA